MTAFNIYKHISKELGLLFPLMERDIVLRKNPIPNNLEFHKKGISKKELSDNMDEISKIYYKIYKYLGEDKFYDYSKKKDVFSYKAKECPDRNVNISTVISILYLSGFRDEELFKRALDFLTK